MRPLIVSRSDLEGGAARAAARLGLALREHGVDAEMVVANKVSDYSWVRGKKGFARSVGATLRSHSGIVLNKLQKGVDPNLRSFNLLPSRLDRALSADGHDVVHLHWVGGEMLSIEAIGRITKPVVWTAHDMWGFMGAEHYGPEGEGARWRVGYTAQSRGAGERGPDLDRAAFLRKVKAWRRPQHVICPSNWLARCTQESALMRDWPVHVIPNPLDLDVFRPWPKALAREMMGLPADVPLLGFGAMGGTSDPRKGWDLLSESLKLVSQADCGAEAVIFGQSRPAKDPGLPFRTHYMGHLHDDIALALLYSAIDVVAVPSRQDNLPQTATEAQACGCPVVAFNVGGLPDAVEHGQTGYLAKPFDTRDFSYHILHLLTDAVVRQNQAKAARERAVKLWDANRLVDLHLGVYQTALDDAVCAT